MMRRTTELLMGLLVMVLVSGCGEELWSLDFGGPGANDMVFPRSVAVDGRGNVAVTGYFHGAIDFGRGPLNSVGTGDLFLASYSGADGRLLWAKSFGQNPGLNHGWAVAADGTGNILVAGDFMGSLDLGGGPLPYPPTSTTFVAKFSPSGAYVWSRSFGVATGLDSAHATAIALDTNGNAVVAGYFLGTVDFGGGPLTSSGGSDIFVAKYSSSGAHLWSRRFGNTGADFGRSVAVDRSGNVIITGDFSGAVDFGGGTLTGPASAIFIAEFSPSGAHLWSRSCGGPGRGVSVAVDGYGHPVFTGYSYGTLDFGGGPVANLSSPHASPFVAKLSSSGTQMWSKDFGSSNAQTDDGFNAVTVDRFGSVILTGSIVDPIDFGGGPLGPMSGEDTFIAKLYPNGEHMWSKRFPQRVPSSDAANAIAADSGGNLIITGDFYLTLDFGGGPLTNVGGTRDGVSTDGFLVKFAP